MTARSRAAHPLPDVEQSGQPPPSPDVLSAASRFTSARSSPGAAARASGNGSTRIPSSAFPQVPAMRPPTRSTGEIQPAGRLRGRANWRVRSASCGRVDGSQGVGGWVRVVGGPPTTTPRGAARSPRAGLPYCRSLLESVDLPPYRGCAAPGRRPAAFSDAPLAPPSGRPAALPGTRPATCSLARGYINRLLPATGARAGRRRRRRFSARAPTGRRPAPDAPHGSVGWLPAHRRARPAGRPCAPRRHPPSWDRAPAPSEKLSQGNDLG
jgi:hypothetical protein